MTLSIEKTTTPNNMQIIVYADCCLRRDLTIFISKANLYLITILSKP